MIFYISRYLKLTTRFLILSSLVGSLSHAQETSESEENSDIDAIEMLLEKNIKFTPSPSLNRNSTIRNPKKVDYKKTPIIGDYQDIAVVQRNYMPKAERFQLTLGGTLVPTDVFFRTYGLNLKGTYHLNEFWGLEGFGFLTGSSARAEVNDLEKNQLVVVKNLISVKSFYGINASYSSIYGKTSILNRKIIPFEIYQTVGIGKVINQNNDESMSFQVGIGELFSISRSSAIRADLTWAFYNATTIAGDTQSANSLFLSVGYSYFFVEPTYR